jgi:hypothetical protein
MVFTTPTNNTIPIPAFPLKGKENACQARLTSRFPPPIVPVNFA